MTWQTPIQFMTKEFEIVVWNPLRAAGKLALTCLAVPFKAVIPCQVTARARHITQWPRMAAETFWTVLWLVCLVLAGVGWCLRLPAAVLERKADRNNLAAFRKWQGWLDGKSQSDCAPRN